MQLLGQGSQAWETRPLPMPTTSYGAHPLAAYNVLKRSCPRAACAMMRCQRACISAGLQFTTELVIAACTLLPHLPCSLLHCTFAAVAFLHASAPLPHTLWSTLLHTCRLLLVLLLACAAVTLPAIRHQPL
jgi:hypothetical protein